MRFIIAICYILFVVSTLEIEAQNKDFFPYKSGDIIVFAVFQGNDRMNDHKVSFVDVSTDSNKNTFFTLNYEGYENPIFSDLKIDSSGNVFGNDWWTPTEKWKILNYELITEENWIAWFYSSEEFEIGRVLSTDTSNYLGIKSEHKNIEYFTAGDSTSSSGFQTIGATVKDSLGFIDVFSYEFGPRYLLKGGKIGDEIFGDTTLTLITSNEEENSFLNDFQLSNYPNPFNPSTTVSYSMKEAGTVVLKLYDITGRFVEEIVNEYKSSGEYKIRFDASNLSSGTYFIRGKLGESISTQKITLIK